MARAAVGRGEIERILAIVDRLGISREAVIIPLRPAHPGGVRVLETGRNRGKLEITVDSEAALDAWLGELEAQLRALVDRGTLGT
jgi:ribonucleotide reductase alpha subunit